MAIKLRDVTQVIRSKNAGSFTLTFDVLFKDVEVYGKVKEKQLINKDLIKKLYGVSDNEVLDVIYFDDALAVKFNIKRKIPSGNFGDRDIYGAQQHAPILDVVLEL
jgi:uncharacterized pyridoxamine 5'-phosphate oxidase family protein